MNIIKIIDNIIEVNNISPIDEGYSIVYKLTFNDIFNHYNEIIKTETFKKVSQIINRPKGYAYNRNRIYKEKYFKLNDINNLKFSGLCYLISFEKIINTEKIDYYVYGIFETINYDDKIIENNFSDLKFDSEKELISSTLIGTYEEIGIVTIQVINLFNNDLIKFNNYFKDFKQKNNKFPIIKNEELIKYLNENNIEIQLDL